MPNSPMPTSRKSKLPKSALGSVGLLAIAALSIGIAAAQEPRPLPGDANGDGVLTKAEMVDDAARRFEAADADKNGAVTAEELKASRTAATEARKQEREGKRRPRRGGEARFAKMWKAADVNKDDVLDLNEMTLQAETRFDAMDADKNGQVTQSEARAYMRQKMKERRAEGGRPQAQ